MLTKKVLELREKAGGYFVDDDLSKEIIDELIDHCRPTLEEFEKIAGGLSASAYVMYRFVMEAPRKWGVGESCANGND